MLVSRFRSSHHSAPPSFANFGIEGPQQLIDLVWLWFRSPHFGLDARTMRTSEPPHQPCFWLHLVACGRRPTYVAPQRAARRLLAMMMSRWMLCGSAVAVIAVALAGGVGLHRATALTPADEQGSHRAVYEI